MSQPVSSLHKNPFWVLQVTTRDNRHKIMEQAEEQALHGDQAECQKSRSDLTNPRARLSAEISWLPGVSPRMAEQLVNTLGDDPLGTRSQGGLPDLAKANLMAAGLEVADHQSAVPQEIADFMEAIARVAEAINGDDILRDINEDRAVAGFTEVRDMAAVESEIEERKRAYKLILKDFLNEMPSKALIETMTLLLDQATESGETHAPALIDELIDSYEIETQGFLQKQQESITKIIASTLACAPSDVAVDLMLNDLESAVRNWSKIAKPIQLSMKARGITHQHSETIGYAIRSLGIELFNKHDLMAQAERTTRLVLEKFADLPEIVEKVQVDVNTLTRLKKEASETSQRNVDWEREITYSGEIGLVFKDTLSISPRGITWKNSTYPLDSINGVRWGAVRKSVNGIPTGTDYTIAFGNSRTATVVSLNREAVYSKFIDCLWRAVCIRLLIEMVKSLKEGSVLIFGNMSVRDDAFQLERHKFLSSNEFVWNSLDDITISSSNGNLLISSKTDKKMYSASSYIEHWNTHILEHLVRGAFKKGCNRLSDYLES